MILKKFQNTLENTSDERFKPLSVGQLKVLDSFQLMALSLVGLVGYLDKFAFKLTKRAFGKNTDLLTRKGINKLNEGVVHMINGGLFIF